MWTWRLNKEKNEMKETNDYGMYSGAFIFDVLDRKALKYVKEQAQLSKKTVLVTQGASVSFKRQLCQKEYKVLCHSYNKIGIGRMYYFCTVDMYDPDNNLVAGANFLFTSATNHCKPERKERKNENTIHNDKRGVLSSD